MKAKAIWVVLFASALMTGCAFSPQKANLNPTIVSSPSSEGQGVTVAIRVVDERPSKSLGRRGTAYGAAAEITAGVDLEQLVSSKIGEALRTKGFNVVGDLPPLAIPVGTSKARW